MAYVLGYTGYGFHEDGLKVLPACATFFSSSVKYIFGIDIYVFDLSQAGKSAAQSLLGQKSSLLLNPKQMVPSWTETGARLLVTRFLNQYVTIGNMT